MRYCDECQLPIDECPRNCPAHIERDIHENEELRKYEIAMDVWEASPDYMETSPY